MLKIEGVSKTFTRTVKKGRRHVKEDFNAVDNISFQVEKGQVFGILGPNGAGKTTLLRMLGGILTPTSGRIELEGRCYSQNKNEVKSHIGYLSGNTKLYGRITPRELLSIFGSLYEMSDEAIKERTEMIFDTLDMHSFSDNRIELLSTGQTQRISIARCLIHSPKLYIFDEPTLGLDVLSSRAIIDFMLEEKKAGKTVLYSTHYMEEAETLCDHIAMMHEGKMMIEGTKEEVKRATGTDNLREAFLKSLEERGGIL